MPTTKLGPPVYHGDLIAFNERLMQFSTDTQEEVIMTKNKIQFRIHLAINRSIDMAKQRHKLDSVAAVMSSNNQALAISCTIDITQEVIQALPLQ